MISNLNVLKRSSAICFCEDLSNLISLGLFLSGGGLVANLEATGSKGHDWWSSGLRVSYCFRYSLHDQVPIGEVMPA